MTQITENISVHTKKQKKSYELLEFVRDIRKHVRLKGGNCEWVPGGTLTILSQSKESECLKEKGIPLCFHD